MSSLIKVGIWKCRVNYDIDELIGSIVRLVKSKWLNWLIHLQRMKGDKHVSVWHPKMESRGAEFDELKKHY